METIFYIYFDLRKYAFIDKNYSHADQFDILSEMHQIIELGMNEINGSMYHIHLDTAMYYTPNTSSSLLVKKLQEIKSKVDEYFFNKNAPSKLHISCAFGESSNGEIKLKVRKIPNILGNVNNHIEQTISATESEKGEVLFDKICFHESVINELVFSDEVKKVTVYGKEFFYL